MRGLRISLLWIVPISVLVFGIFFFSKYKTSDVMFIPIQELTTQEYPDDPADHSRKYGLYGNRHLRLIKKEGNHFDFSFESSNPNAATIVLQNVDVGLMIPTKPKWVKEDKNLELITFVEREWNRQQVKFGRASGQLQIKEGDGFETESLFSAELSRNSLNAGLWEIQLYANEGGKKALYYQGWFNFPLGHYKDVFEENNQITYWRFWNSLEHWNDPEGTLVNLLNLRKIVSEKVVPIIQHKSEEMLADGEQIQKRKLYNHEAIKCFGDICSDKEITFSALIPPGRYDSEKRQKNEFYRFKNPEKAFVRKIVSPGAYEALTEIEIVFKNEAGKDASRLIISGIDLSSLPAAKERDYSRGIQMPFGIAVPPFYQNYEELKRKPPQKSPYFSLLLDGQYRWMNHHRAAIDGHIIHRDEWNPSKYHIYLLSYERQAVISHYVIFI